MRRLVDHWGVVTEAASKTVWFELHSADRFNADNPDLDRTSKQRLTVGAQRSTNSALVTLLDVPLLLHAAWQVHVDALLREYLLAQLGDDTATAEIEEHAAAHDAMALLREQIPKPVLSSDVHELMSHATEPEMTAKEVILEVPLRSVNNFRTLDVRCEAALVLADHEKLITPPTQPEIRMLRWWLCEQVLAQIAGASPTSWTQVSQNVPVPYRTTTSDIEEVSASDRALIAADRSDQIVAVSRGALELLRYATADELVAHRLIDIIPARFRQAHLAGFTLYLSTGRSPLLGQAVTVPALTKDNQEVIVRLTVTAHNREGEATLFVAEFEPSSDAEDVQGHGALSRSGCP